MMRALFKICLCVLAITAFQQEPGAPLVNAFRQFTENLIDVECKAQHCLLA